MCVEHVCKWSIRRGLWLEYEVWGIWVDYEEDYWACGWIMRVRFVMWVDNEGLVMWMENEGSVCGRSMRGGVFVLGIGWGMWMAQEGMWVWHDGMRMDNVCGLNMMQEDVVCGWSMRFDFSS
ncbi:hypothetical protein DPMN_145446 [Dreissena polymorpha]|uniref:Uncharacterized protein n=1 Tax=Dreissena polymorpha TaxID=45954 RepID=A0A9D4F9X0_DREPO|nr:hypothetical protein DPMN_145446 [Dreissena polymorpha]